MEYKLTSAEMYCLAQVSEKESIYGIGNPFYGLSEDEIDLKLKKTFIDLQMKKYVLEDFEGNIVITDELKKMVDSCSDFDLMISIETIRDGKYEIQYYFMLDGILTYFIPSEEEFECGFSSAEDVKEILLHLTESNPEVSEVSDVRMKVDLPQLEYYRGRIAEGGKLDVVREISEAGNDNELASIYASAVERKADYTGIIFTYNEERYNNEGDTILYISKDDRLVAVQYEMIDYIDTVVLRDITKSEIYERVKTQLESFG